MKTVAEILFILLFINENFASEETLLQNFDFTPDINGENVRLELMNAVTTEVSHIETKLEITVELPPKRSLNLEELRENRNNYVEQTLPQTLNLTDKEQFEVVLKKVDKVESSTEYLTKTTPIQLPRELPQDINLCKSELVNIILKNITNLTNSPKELKGNVDSSRENLANIRPKQLLSAEKELKNSNLADNDLVQIILEKKPNIMEKSSKFLVKVEASATDGNETKSLTSLEEIQNSNFSDSELTLKNFRHLSNRQEKSDDSEYEITPIPLNNFTESEFVPSSLKHLPNIPENKENNEENSSKPMSSSEKFQNLNLTNSVVVKIVLKEKQNLANNQERMEDGAESFNSNTKSLITLAQLENPKQSVSEMVLKESSNLLEKEEEIRNSVYNSSEPVIHGYTKIIAEYGTNAEPVGESDLSDKEAKEKETSENAPESLHAIAIPESDIRIKSANALQVSENPTLTESVLKDLPLLSNKQDESKNLLDSSTEVLVDKNSKTLNEYKIDTKLLNSLEVSQNLNFTESDLVRIVLKDVTNLTDKPKNHLESPSAVNTTTGAVADMSKLSTKRLNSNLTESDFVQIILKDVTNLTPKPNDSFESSYEVDTTTTTATTAITATTTTTTITMSELASKSLTSLEEYAVQQMSFILDHLLLEMQEFVANVLQASVNLVYPRDNLKRYAEALNRVLKPDSDSDYSEEVIEQNKFTNQDQIYEEMVRKLNFLKTKPSRYLQKYLPQEWINDFRNKKAELVIWLDKVIGQMHQKLIRYISEEEDHIKYQYFNETFDDISRATEIHNKLALLADLVKIVKNKKQITFMDLYMQT